MRRYGKSMSNVLSRAKQLAVLSALVEGCSIRSTERMLDVSRETVLSLLVRVGEGCARVLDETMRNLDGDSFELDEIWSYVGKKQRHVSIHDNPDEVGDVWTFVAIDSYSKLVPCYRVGKRDRWNTDKFVADLARRLNGERRVQISTDGLSLYVGAIEDAFGSDVDYGQIVKGFESDPIGPGRYSPPKVSSATRIRVSGTPDEDAICTSYVERQNLTMRMGIRRFTRLTNAFSKKVRNHRAAIALHFTHYNFARTHGTLRTSPAMAAGVSTKLWEMGDLLDAALEGAIP